MERHPSPQLGRERAEDRTLRLLADEAQQLAPRFERLETAAYQALTNHRIQGAERTRMFGQIMAELRKREAARKRADEHRRDEMRPGPARIQPGIFKDAYAHERSQPPDTYDIDAEEEARRSA